MSIYPVLKHFKILGRLLKRPIEEIIVMKLYFIISQNLSENKQLIRIVPREHNHKRVNSILSCA